MIDSARRRWMQALATVVSVPAAARAGAPSSPPKPFDFPRDHGAHPATRIEWWYATGWLVPSDADDGINAAPTHGFQLTFFRSRTGLADDVPGRFAARQLLFAHAAVTDLVQREHRDDQRIVRWNGEPGAALGEAALDRGAVRIGTWSLLDLGSAWQAEIATAGFTLRLTLTRTQPPIAQGTAGVSRKGPDPAQFSRYYSEPQLAVSGSIDLDARRVDAHGRAWFDHEWSDHLLAPGAVGWDWCGIDLFDGSALMAFVIRRADGSVLWAGGSWRMAGRAAIDFAPAEVRWQPLRRWHSRVSGADYPVHWRLETPAGRFELRALQDAQELDSRASTGSIYWEGLSELLDVRGRRVGLGYLEMTGYAQPLRM